MTETTDLNDSTESLFTVFMWRLFQFRIVRGKNNCCLCCMLWMVFDMRESSCSGRIQSDLHKLEKWEEEWLMSFNPDKCEIIHISRKQKPIIFQYTLHNQVLKSTNKAKCLGVTITNDLTLNHHINNITNKANASLRFIKRNVKTKELAYKTYVRPKVEYCSVVWDPWQKQQINKIEMIQRRAARYTLNQYSYHSSVSAMLQLLCWPTLQQKRNLASVTISNLHYLVPYDQEITNSYSHSLPQIIIYTHFSLEQSGCGIHYQTR